MYCIKQGEINEAQCLMCWEYGREYRWCEEIYTHEGCQNCNIRSSSGNDNNNN